MQFFLDTANLEDIKHFASLGMVDGVTTNPSLLAKEGVDMEARIKEIAEVVDGPISAEVIATDYEGMLEEGRRNASWHKNVVVKIPMTENGLRAIKTLTSEGIKVNTTLIFSASQALLAAKAGATYISPFIGRLDDISEDGMGLIEEIMQMFEHYEFETKVLVASVRHPRHVVEAAKLGAHVITMPAKVLEKMMQHPLTVKGLEKFLSDWEAANK